MDSPGSVTFKAEATAVASTAAVPARLHACLDTLNRQLLSDHPLDAVASLMHHLGSSPPPAPDLAAQEADEAVDLKLELTALAFEIKREVRSRVHEGVPPMSEIRQIPGLLDLDRSLSRAMAALVPRGPDSLGRPWASVWPVVRALLILKHAERLRKALDREIESHLEKLTGAVDLTPGEAVDDLEVATAVYRNFRPRFDPLVAESLAKLRQEWHQCQKWIVRIRDAEYWIRGQH